MLNKRGASGSPYLSPLCGMNSSEGLPLTNTEIEADLRHPSIHWIHLEQKPILLNMYIKKFQETES